MEVPGSNVIIHIAYLQITNNCVSNIKSMMEIFVNVLFFTVSAPRPIQSVSRDVRVWFCPGTALTGDFWLKSVFAKIAKL